MGEKLKESLNLSQQEEKKNKEKSILIWGILRSAR